MMWRSVRLGLTLPANDFQQRTNGAPVKAVWRQIGRAWDATLALEFAHARALVTAAEWNTAGLSAGDVAPIIREIGLLQAAIYAYGDDSVTSLETIGQIALGTGASGAIATTICRLAHWRRRDFKALRSLGMASLPTTYKRRTVLPAIFDISIEAAVAFEHLRFPVAKQLARDAIALSETTLGRNDAVAAFAASIAAQLAYEEDRLDEAEQLIYERLPAVRARGDIECAIRAFIVMARVSTHRGQVDLATQILEQANKLAQRRGWPRLLAASLLQQIEIALACGRLDDAKLALSHLEDLANGPCLGDHFAHRDIRRYALTGRARFERVVAPSPHVTAVFRELHQDALRRRQLFEALQLAVLLADALAAIGEISEAIETLHSALRTGTPIGVCRVFLDGGETIRPLLRTLHERLCKASDWDETTIYLDSLLSHSDIRLRPPNVVSAGPRGLISERELTIIQLVGTGLPNKRIAQSLGII
jgi:LuxR family maltose regulon positive regulatory protein